jgi:hypothetical protein
MLGEPKRLTKLRTSTGKIPFRSKGLAEVNLRPHIVWIELAALS